MANLAKLNIDTGPGSTWNALTFTASELNSLASGGAALSTTTIANSSNLDLLVDVSFVVTVGGTTVAGGYFPIWLMPLNQDGSTYGDGYASSTTVQPAATYQRGSVIPKLGVTSGNTVVGMLEQLTMSPGDYKVAIGNSLTVALNSTAALTLKYRVYNLTLNG